jgi:UDPglucose--hexose-1-phosphate uridylyltransferase
MSELRQDSTTREWVIIATERARRPDEFATAKGDKAIEIPEYVESCPFCPGHEALTPKELYAIRKGGKKRTAPWQVRVIPNKFPALRPTEDPARLQVGLFRGVGGFGDHEVIIESTRHNGYLALMEDAEVEDVLTAYRERYLSLRKDPRVKFIVIFKNHGKAAGTSIEHPHSQIVAVPIMPGGVRAKIDVAERYYDDNGACVYCSLLEEELYSKDRIVMESNGYVAFEPFASRVPFETWIMPRKHATSFCMLSESDSHLVAPVIRTILAKLFKGLRNPDFNMIFHSAPMEDEDTPYYHWHIQILPRLTLQAGFELGSGIYINSTLPEQTAEFLRNTEV